MRIVNPYQFGPSPWSDGFDGNWAHRVKATAQASKVPSNQTDIPCYLDLSLLPAGFHSKVQTDGDDIRVTDSGGLVELPVEIVAINPGGSTGETHMEIDALDGTSNTDVYVYYNNPSAARPAVTDTYGRNAVWANSFVWVQHCEDKDALVDSSGNESDATKVGTPDNQAGKVGGGLHFDAPSSEGVSLDTTTLTDFPVTMEAWVNGDVSSGDFTHLLIADKDDTGDDSYFLIGNSSFLSDRNWLLAQSDSAAQAIAGTDLRGAWHHICATLTSATLREYFEDAVSVDTDTASVPWPTPINRWAFGYGAHFTASSYLPGLMDEVRISSVVRADDWITTSYNNQNSNSTFWVIGAEEAKS